MAEIDQILAHLRGSVERDEWFEINEAAAAILLAHIERLDYAVPSTITDQMHTSKTDDKAAIAKMIADG